MLHVRCLSFDALHTAGFFLLLPCKTNKLEMNPAALVRAVDPL